MSDIIWFGSALIIGVSVASANAQEQKTLGPCSPAIAGVQGNVLVTCLTGDRRIRIAKYSNHVDLGYFLFLENNCGQIIQLDGAITDIQEGLYNERDNTLTYGPNLKDHRLNDIQVRFNKDDKPSQRFEPRYLEFDGYYFVECKFLSYSLSTIFLRRIDDKEILLSDKYDTR